MILYGFENSRKSPTILNKVQLFQEKGIVPGKKQITICSISDLSKRFFINKFESNLIII